jgi:phospholipase C
VKQALAAVLLTAILALPVTAGLAAAPLEGLPHYDHVFVLVEENESIGNTYGPASPDVYLKSLAKSGAFADHYYATGHVSLDNYIAMISGQPDVVATTGTDCAGLSLYVCAQGQQALAGGRNLADQLEAAGVSWKGYMDGTTAPCQHDTYSVTSTAADRYQGNGGTPAPAGKDYADRHNPFLYFPDIIGDSARCSAHVRPFTELGPAIAANSLPQFGFITPDTCHDGHDSPCSPGGTGNRAGGLVSTDAWLVANLPPLLAYLRSHNGLLLVTDDEGNFPSDNTGCCTGGPGGTAGFGGRVGLIALGPGVKAGQTVTTSYDHASLLRTLESLFGIDEHLNNAASAVVMKDLFSVSAVTASPAAGASPAGVSPGPTGQLPATEAGARRPAVLGVGALGALALLLAGAGAWAARRRRPHGPRRHDRAKP